MVLRLNKEYRYTVLCEDKLTQCFVRRFLIASGINGRKIYPLPLPVAGCGEQYVREQFPQQLKALRAKNYNSNVLFTIIDADSYTYEEREKMLEDACKISETDLRKKTDNILLFIPKRNIETWIKHFGGEKVDEKTDYAHFLNGHEKDSYLAAEKMAQEFMKSSITYPLLSLQKAYEEYLQLVKKIS